MIIFLDISFCYKSNTHKYFRSAESMNPYTRRRRSYRRLRNYLRNRMNSPPNFSYTFASLPPSTTSDSDSEMSQNDQPNSHEPANMGRFTWPPKRFLRQLRAANQSPVRKNTRKVFSSSSSSSSSSSESSDDSSVVIIEPEPNLDQGQLKTSPKMVKNGTPGKGAPSFTDRAVKCNQSEWSCFQD